MHCIIHTFHQAFLPYPISREARLRGGNTSEPFAQISNREPRPVGPDNVARHVPLYEWRKSVEKSGKDAAQV